ncbi:erythromycin esterase family protein [Hazenella coriacea]|uniref:Erythromycin esterase n=1 Tax=Hazenella coriacea TaxID=1179467 RepID=A0A4R3LBC5_9BACL|nr:erythromycin esterase family protein [Hazenella coriacea]TCS96598.1 erythromycin esterase [Hazenella coriacea]
MWVSLFLVAFLSVGAFPSWVSAQPIGSEKDWQHWVQKHANPIKILSPSENDHYKDLHFLKQTLKDKRIVLLGESSHGAAEFNSSKVRMIQYLHKELGYEVISFESGLAENHAAFIESGQKPPLTTMQNSIFGVWHSQETLPLFDYIKEQKNTKNPLILSGFDNQPMATYSPFVRDWFKQVDPKVAELAFQLENKFVHYYYMESDINAFKKEQPHLIAQYQQLLSFVESHESQLQKIYPQHPELTKVTKYTFQDRIDSINQMIEPSILLQKYLEEEDYEKAGENMDRLSVVRDKAMAKHLTWVADELYPDKKIIAWGHNYHIRKNNSQITAPYRGSLVTMGELLPDHIKKQTYTVGLYMNRGESASNNRVPMPVRYPHPTGTMESILGKHMKSPAIFVDLAKHKNKKGTSWMYTPRLALDWGFMEEELLPRDQYDGILFIDETHLPNYIPPASSQKQQSKASIQGFQPLSSSSLNSKVDHLHLNPNH